VRTPTAAAKALTNFNRPPIIIVNGRGVVPYNAASAHEEGPQTSTTTTITTTKESG